MPTIKDVILDKSIKNFSDAEKFVLQELELMQKNGSLALGEDKNLTGRALELRVYELFKINSHNVLAGRPSLEDFVVLPGRDFAIQDRLAVEVKSSRRSQLSLDDLRQLDDWVYDLSGEEKARKHGLGGGVKPATIATDGFISAAEGHPTPHKGLLIFNGQIGIAFDQRVRQCMHSNQQDFAVSRNFCVISLADFIDLMSKDSEEAWNAIHKTIGEYSGDA